MFLKCLGFSGRKHTSSSQRKYPRVIEELCHPFSLADLRKMTNNFNQNRVVVDAFFEELYKGCLQHSDASEYTVTVRRFDVKDSQSLKEFRIK